MSDLIEKLRLACDDPMWADHVEMPKKLLRHAVDYLDALKKQVEELTKALEFYADVSKYPAPLTGGMGDLWADCGQIARAALTSTKETGDAG